MEVGEPVSRLFWMFRQEMEECRCMWSNGLGTAHILEASLCPHDGLVVGVRERKQGDSR